MEEEKYKMQIRLLEQEIAKYKDIDIKRDKTVSFYSRIALRVLAWGVLVFYVIYRIAFALVAKEPVYMDSNDGWIILVSIGLLLAIEGVKKAYEVWAMKKASSI